jgi:hypothetical protein
MDFFRRRRRMKTTFQWWRLLANQLLVEAMVKAVVEGLANQEDLALVLSVLSFRIM